MPITPEEQVASRTDPITLPEMLRRLAIELAARDIPFRHIEQAFAAVSKDALLGWPVRGDLAAWADGLTAPFLSVIGSSREDPL